MAVSIVDIPDIGTGDPGGHRRGAPVLLRTWKAGFQRAQAVLFLLGAPVDTGCLALLQLCDGDRVAGVVFVLSGMR